MPTSQKYHDNKYAGQGKCGKTIADCERGGENLVPPIECAGHGIAYTEQFTGIRKCYCGTPRQADKNIKDIIQVSELAKNGFAGMFCMNYECGEPSTAIEFSKYDRKNDLFWTDVDGNPILGRWIGPCGCPVGPDAEDTAIWQHCG